MYLLCRPRPFFIAACNSYPETGDIIRGITDCLLSNAVAINGGTKRVLLLPRPLFPTTAAPPPPPRFVLPSPSKQSRTDKLSYNMRTYASFTKGVERGEHHPGLPTPFASHDGRSGRLDSYFFSKSFARKHRTYQTEPAQEEDR